GWSRGHGRRAYGGAPGNACAWRTFHARRHPTANSGPTRHARPHARATARHHASDASPNANSRQVAAPAPYTHRVSPVAPRAARTARTNASSKRPAHYLSVLDLPPEAIVSVLELALELK